MTDNKKQNAYFYVELDPNCVMVETKTMILYNITDKKDLWIPVKNIYKKPISGKIYIMIFKNDTMKLRLVDKNNNNVFNEVTLFSLVETIYENNKKSNFIIKKL